MILLWQFGIIDSLTFAQFCVNCASQYGALTLAEVANSMGDLRPKVFLAPIQGLGTSYQFVRAAQGAMERRSRIATVACFMAMSGRATLTDPGTNAAAGATISNFILHMKHLIEKASNNSTGGLIFGNPAILSKLTNDEFIVLHVVIVSGVLLIIISSYVLPRIAKAYWNSSKILLQYIKTFDKSKIFLPFKYVGFIERIVIKLISSILVRNKIL